MRFWNDIACERFADILILSEMRFRDLKNKFLLSYPTNTEFVNEVLNKAKSMFENKYLQFVMYKFDELGGFEDEDINVLDKIKIDVDRHQKLVKSGILKKLFGKEFDRFVDINNWLKIDYNIFLDNLNKYEQNKGYKRKEKAKKKTFKAKKDVVYEDEDFVFIVPNSIKSACKYGKNTKWCISARKSRNYLLDYAAEGYNILIIDKKKKQNNKFSMTIDFDGEINELVDDQSIVDEEGEHKYYSYEEFFSDNLWGDNNRTRKIERICNAIKDKLVKVNFKTAFDRFFSIMIESNEYQLPITYKNNILKIELIDLETIADTISFKDYIHEFAEDETLAPIKFLYENNKSIVEIKIHNNLNKLLIDEINSLLESINNYYQVGLFEKKLKKLNKKLNILYDIRLFFENEYFEDFSLLLIIEYIHLKNTKRQDSVIEDKIKEYFIEITNSPTKINVIVEYTKSFTFIKIGSYLHLFAKILNNLDKFIDYIEKNEQKIQNDIERIIK